MRERFRKFAVWAAIWAGEPLTFLVSVLATVVWLIAGPFYSFSDTWQLVANTATTVITFLLVFIVQATQNRNDRAMQLKLDELIRSSKARNRFVELEEATEEELAAIHRKFKELRAEEEA